MKWFICFILLSYLIVNITSESISSKSMKSVIRNKFKIRDYLMLRKININVLSIEEKKAKN